jgi:hypothetical protein
MNQNPKLTPEMLLWKQLEIARCEMNFSCGGDSMNDYDFNFYKANNEEVESSVLEDYFESEVWKNVEFYEASDGHYMGEAGVVLIQLDEDDEDNPQFYYAKDAESEWQETIDRVASMPITEDYRRFLNEKVESVIGGDGEGINFKEDTILSNEDVEIMEKLQNDIRNFAEEFDFEFEGEQNDWFRFTTNLADSNGDVEFEADTIQYDENGNLLVLIEKSFYTYTPSND